MTPFSTSILVCRSSQFSQDVRDIVLKTMDMYKDVEFVETEFQPQSIQPAYPGIHILDRGEMELEKWSVVKPTDGRVRLRKAINKVTADTSRETEEVNRRLVKSHSGATSTLTTVDEEAGEMKDLEEQSLGGKVNGKEIV